MPKDSETDDHPHTSTTTTALLAMMSPTVTVLCFLLALVLTNSSSSASPLVFSGRLVVPPNNVPPPSTLVTLNGGEYSALSSSSTGDFVFPVVPPGVYLLDVTSSTHAYPQVKVKVDDDVSLTPRCNLYVYAGAEKKSVECYPLLLLPAVATYSYFEVKPPFSVRSIFMNPMLLMMLVPAAMAWYMPKMMEGMDPEQRAAMQKQMESQSDPTKMFDELKESFFGGGDGEEDKNKGGGAKKAQIDNEAAAAPKKRGKKDRE